MSHVSSSSGISRILVLAVVATFVLLALAGCGGGGGATIGSSDDHMTVGTLFGHVTEKDTKTAVTGVQLALAPASTVVRTTKPGGGTGRAANPISIDGNGSYESPGMTQGRYALSASCTGFDSYTTEVDIVGGQRTQHDFAMTISSGTTGVRGVLRSAVDRQPVSGATLTLQNTSTGSVKNAPRAPVTVTTNADGSYVLPNLTAGLYVATIQHPKYLSRAAKIRITAGQMQGLDLLLTPGNPSTRGDIWGFVRNTAGEGIPQANVSLDYSISGVRAPKTGTPRADETPSSTGFAQSDGDGFYWFDQLLPGSYVIKAEHPGYLANSVQASVTAGAMSGTIITLSWRLVYNGQADYFMGLWGTSATDLYAVGALGVIKHYDGTRWTYLPSPTGEHLWDVWGTTDASLILAVGNGNKVLRSTDRGATWEISGAGISASCHAVWGTPDGRAVFMISHDGTFFKSTDRGQTWIAGTYSATPVPATTSSQLNDISGTPDGNTIFVTGASGVIHRSTDGGGTWQALQTGQAESFKRIHCWSDGGQARVVATGYTTRATIHSLDGGATWARSDLPTLPDMTGYEQRAIWGRGDGSPIYLLASANKGAYVVQSLDEGQTWTKVADADILDYTLWGTPSGGDLFIAGGEGRVWKGGTLVNQGAVWSLYSVFALSDTEMCATGRVQPEPAGGRYGAGVRGSEGSFAAATMSAVLWTQDLRSIWGTSADRLFAAAGERGIFTSTDRGATWAQWAKTPSYSFSGLSGGSPVVPLIAAGYDHNAGTPDYDKGVVVYQVWDETWRSVHFDPGVHLRAVAKVTDGIAFVTVGEQGSIFYSDVSASTWTRVVVDGVTATLHDVWSSPTDRILFAVGDNGTLLKSIHGGMSWIKYALGTGPLYSVWGSSNNDVYAAGLEIYHYNGGNWTKMTSQNLGSVETDKFMAVSIRGTPDGKKVYAVGLGGRVYVHEPK